MDEKGTGEKWTCCLFSEVLLALGGGAFSGVLRPEVDEQEEEEVGEGGAEREEEKQEPKRAVRAALCAACAAAARVAMILASTALVVGVGTAHNAEQSLLLRRMLRPMCVPEEEESETSDPEQEESGGSPWISRGDVFHSVSALWTTVLDPS